MTEATLEEAHLETCGKLAVFMSRLRKDVRHYQYLVGKKPDDPLIYYKAKILKEVSEDFENLIKRGG